MGLGSTVPGRYTAQIKDWGVREVIELGTIECWIAFDFKDQAGGMQSISWKGLLHKKDGERNKKTFKTLVDCGLESEDIIEFMESPSALNTQEMLDITIEDQLGKDGNTYKTVEWVNKVGGGQRNKPEGQAAMDLKSKLAAMGLGKIKPGKAAAAKKPQNYAPGADNGAKDDLGF